MKNIDIYFSEGLNVITGETGTGKSLLLDVIGSFLDYQNIRSETFSADMVVDLPNDFEDLGVKKGQRIFTIERKNKKMFYKIDGKLVGRDIVQQTLSTIITIHKQNSHMKLLDKDFILEVLDNIADNSELLEEYGARFREYQQLLKIISNGNRDMEVRKLEELKEKVREIKEANLDIQEEQELEERYKKSLNIQTTLQNYTTSLQQLEEVEYALRKMYNLIEESHHLLLDTAIESIAELSNKIGKEISKLEEINVEEIENRLWVYKKLRRKYGPTTEDVLINFSKWNSEIKEIEKTIEILDNAATKMSRLEKELHTLASELSQRRKDAALKITEMIAKHLKDLNMNARLEFSFKQKGISKNGTDEVELIGSTLSKGQLYPLRKIASGGELSRLMLSLELSLASTDVLVYDEIDAGIGGVTAVKLAEKLSDLSKNHQVIVVTHLPQIALKADKHFALRRFNDEGTIEELNEEGRSHEIKRMFGGNEVIDIIGDLKDNLKDNSKE